jgi:broad specificity phosphatase PhoE
MSNRLYLVRHGENPANITKEFSSRRIDYSLNEKGVLQAQQTAKFFMDKNIHTVYASPLKRAKETAEIIAAELGLAVVVMDQFREIDVGFLEEQPVSNALWDYHHQVLRDWWEGFHSAAFPGGDNYGTLWNRMQNGLLEIVDGKMDQNLVVVGHGGLFSTTIKDLVPDVDRQLIFTKKNQNCSISELILCANSERVVGKLVSWCEIDHLSGEAADFVPGIPD